jgi:ketosteroid isomerase-like protein
MPAKSPEEICWLFQQYMAEGDIDAVLSVYDPEAVFLNRTGEVKKNGQALKQDLAPFAAMKAVFEFNIKQVVQADDSADDTDWKLSSPEPMSVYAIEVARRQEDGTWRWLIGDPFTFAVGRILSRHLKLYNL